MQGEWIMHDGKDIPVGDDELVVVRFRNGYAWNLPLPAERHDWVHHKPGARGRSGDVVAYRVVKNEDGLGR